MEVSSHEKWSQLHVTDPYQCKKKRRCPKTPPDPRKGEIYKHRGQKTKANKQKQPRGLTKKVAMPEDTAVSKEDLLKHRCSKRS